MPIDAVCPNCLANYRLADTMHGKQVRCKGCQQPFTVQAAQEAETAELAEEAPVSSSRLQARAPAKAPPLPPRTGIHGSKARHTTNGDSGAHKPVHAREEDGEVGRKKSSLALVLCLVIGGVLLLGGVGTAVLLVVLNSGKNDANQVNEEELRANADFERNLTDLKSHDDRVYRPAMFYFIRNPKLDHPKRAVVARELMRLFELNVPNFVQHNNDTGDALRIWATKEQIPIFVQYAKQDQVGGFPNQYRRALSLEMLGVLKDEASIPLLVENLQTNNFQTKPAALKGLTAMGPVAKNGVLKIYFAQDGFNNAQADARRLVKLWGVTPDEILAQAFLDLKTGDSRVKAEVCRYLADPSTPLNEKRRPEAAKELESQMQVDENSLRDWALRALARWGTSDTVPVLVRQLEFKEPANGPEAKALGYFKDERAAEALAKNLTKGYARYDTLEALKNLGPKYASKAVLPLLNSNDYGLKNSVRNLVKDWNLKTDEVARQCAADLADSNQQKRKAALDWLAEADVVPDVAAQVVEAVKPLTFSANKQTAQLAQTVMIKWSTKADATAGLGAHLLKLQSNNANTRRLGMNALKASGPEVAGKAVLSQFNHPDFGIRFEIRDLVRDWDIKTPDIVKQCLADLGGIELKRGQAAIGWLAEADPVPTLAKDVVTMVAPLTASKDFEIGRHAKTVMQRWGSVVVVKEDPKTKENPTEKPTVAIDTLLLSFQSPDPATKKMAVEELIKSKDDKAVAAFGVWLVSAKTMAERGRAGDALREIGGSTTEKLMCQFLTLPAYKLLVPEICRVLEVVGTDTPPTMTALTTAMNYYGQGPTKSVPAYNAIKKAQEKIKTQGK